MLFKPVIFILILIYFPWYFLLKYELVASYYRLLIFWTLLIFLYAVHQYFLWLLNVYILTDKRLIKVEYRSMMNKQVLESPLNRILNVSFGIHGFWQALFSFGSVDVQVAGLSHPLILKNVSHPAEIKDMLWKIHGKYAPNVFNGSTSENIAVHKPIN